MSLDDIEVVDSGLTDFLASEQSPARPCFDVVPSEPYQKMTLASVDTVIASYKRRCASFGVQL